MQHINLLRAYVLPAFGLLIGAAYAVTLEDFTPRPNGLTSGCHDVYLSNISGCSSSDFANSAPCSASCVDGVVSLNLRVIQACAGDARNNQNIIAAFLAGDGIHDLCPNIVVRTLAAYTNQASSTSGKAPIATPGLNSNHLTPSQSMSVEPQNSLSLGLSSSSSTPSATYNYPPKISSNSFAPTVVTTYTSPSSSTSLLGTYPSEPNPIIFTGPSAESTESASSGKQSCGSPFNWCNSSGAATSTSFPRLSMFLSFWVLLICIGKFNG